jgi:hypothetical protein
MSVENRCIYCTNLYQKNGEHVFPNGLGGQDIFMDCVCGVCNNYFSGLERELYQKSPVGLMRSTYGVEGYNPNPTNPAPFKAPILVCLDKKNKHVFEVGQYAKMKIGLRPQMYYHRDRYYVEGDHQENAALFALAFSNWKAKNSILTARIEDEIAMVKFELVSGNYQRTLLSGKQSTKKAIQFCTLPQDHKLFNKLSPRLFIDDDGKLKIRAKTFKEAQDFLEAVLLDTQTNNRYTSLQNKQLDKPTIEVGFSFDALKLEQALVKIGLNCLIHCYPATKTSLAIKPHVNFVMGKKPNYIIRSKEEKDQIRDSMEGHHNIFFAQVEQKVNVRISLFNGMFVFSFWIEDLSIMKPINYSRLLINYSDRIHMFQETNAFLMSFMPEKRDI